MDLQACPVHPEQQAGNSRLLLAALAGHFLGIINLMVEKRVLLLSFVGLPESSPPRSASSLSNRDKSLSNRLMCLSTYEIERLIRDSAYYHFISLCGQTDFVFLQFRRRLPRCFNFFHVFFHFALCHFVSFSVVVLALHIKQIICFVLTLIIFSASAFCCSTFSSISRMSLKLLESSPGRGSRLSINCSK